VLAALMRVIDASIVNVALRDMVATSAPISTKARSSPGYILASVIIIRLTDFLGDLFGRKSSISLLHHSLHRRVRR
jgi:hypothetical protein